MNTKQLTLTDMPILPVPNRFQYKAVEPILLFIGLLFLWFLAPGWMQDENGTVGSVDQSIWLLVLLSLITFLLIVAVCSWLLQHFWTMMGLPNFSFMVSQFKTLQLWQQLSFYWASFALLLLAAIGCLAAVC